MLRISVYTIEKKLFEGEADSAQFPGIDGEFGVLSLHVPLIAPLGRGRIRLRGKGGVTELPVNGGFVEVAPGSLVTVLAD